MKKIFKYILKAQETQFIQIQSEQILSAESQGDNIVVYALVNDGIEEPLSYEFAIYGTGHKVNIFTEHYNFLDTVKMDNGNLMFHVFYRKL